MLVKLLCSACFGVGALVVRWLAVILLWLFWFHCSVMLRVLVVYSLCLLCVWLGELLLCVLFLWVLCIVVWFNGCVDYCLGYVVWVT